MSGGSWDYCHSHIEDVADRLCCEADPRRRALGKRLHLFARALHDIEWADSGDYGPGAEEPAIDEALAAFGDPEAQTLAAMVAPLEATLALVRKLLEAGG
jgi:hypothetical protein